LRSKKTASFQNWKTLFLSTKLYFTKNITPPAGT
jgi:hypothetical protein